MFSSNGSQVSDSVPYIEDMFSTYLYTGTGATQTITNGIDLSGKGGLTWIKGRSGATDHALYDTARGATFDLVSNSSAAQTTQATGLTAFGSTGFSIGALAKLNTSAATYASWTFRKQPKFFDVVTYTGTGLDRTIAHNLGSVPGCVIVKCTSTGGTAVHNWFVGHRSLASNEFLQLNTTDAVASGGGMFNTNTVPNTSTTFSVGTNAGTNQSGQTYVAYLFAHNAGGFGLTGTDNVISCGSFTTDGSGNATVNLGYEPQFLIDKNSSATGSWFVTDIMRGMSVTSFGYVNANLTAAESSGAGQVYVPTSTGFQVVGFTAGVTHIYIAIRKGPMKVPTVGTSVFEIVARSGNNTNTTVGTSLTADATIIKCRNTITNSPFALWADRLRGSNYIRMDSSSLAESISANLLQTNPWDVQAGVKVGTGGATTNATNALFTYINYLFKRAPNFMDVVCYTGVNSGSQTLAVSHNLATTPELIGIRNRAGSNFFVYTAPTGTANKLLINRDDASSANSLVSAVSSSTFTVSSAGGGNINTNTYLAFLFATCPNVSKVGSYTGTGALQTIDCGFTSGARFVMIKRTSSTGAWYFWDSTRGITSGNDPYLVINVASAETTGTNYVDTVSTGFQVTAAASAEINGSGGSFIFLAIA